MIQVPEGALHALDALNSVLGASVQAVYLHGSAVLGGLRPNSDIDLLVCVENPLTLVERTQLTQALKLLSGHYPKDPQNRRPLEVILFDRATLEAGSYPACCTYIYGEWLREEKGQSIPMPDPEMTLVLAQAQQAVHVLYQADKAPSLPFIPQGDVLRAMAAVGSSLLTAMSGDERNIILTLARMWYTAETGLFESKDKAAEWAMERLPEKEASLMGLIRTAYLTGNDSAWQKDLPEVAGLAQILLQKQEKAPQS